MSFQHVFTQRTFRIAAAIAVGTATMNTLTADTFIALIIPAAHATDVEVTDTGVGIGTPAPERLLHMKGGNAVFRMDRPLDTSAFMIVRTDSAGNILKNFVVGTNASGVNRGEFIINDLATASGGAGSRRLTIDNTGTATFTGLVQASGFSSTSSIRFKENVQPIQDAERLVNNMRGVSFTWKQSGKKSLGLIAEELLTVLPEAVTLEDNGRDAKGINYSAIVPVLVEAIKAQSDQINKLEHEVYDLREKITENK
jgi:hypothetical protein